MFSLEEFYVEWSLYIKDIFIYLKQNNVGWKGKDSCHNIPSPGSSK